MRIDALNLNIIRLLKDGRLAFKEIADKLQVTENTVRNRVNRLKEAGVLEISGLVDPEKLPGHTLVLIGVKLKSVDLVIKGKELAGLQGVISVSVVTGRYDLFLHVLLKEGFGLLEFYTQQIAKVKDIREVETFVIYKGYNNFVPYVL